jgi:hypothetical protein
MKKFAKNKSRVPVWQRIPMNEDNTDDCLTLKPQQMIGDDFRGSRDGRGAHLNPGVPG